MSGKSVQLLAAAMIAFSSSGESIPYSYKKSKVIEPIWVRKKCKTCKTYSKFHSCDFVRKYRAPMDSACENWKPKTK